MQDRQRLHAGTAALTAPRPPNYAANVWVTDKSLPDFSWTDDRGKTKVGLVPADVTAQEMTLLAAHTIRYYRQLRARDRGFEQGANRVAERLCHPRIAMRRAARDSSTAA